MEKMCFLSTPKKKGIFVHGTNAVSLGHAAHSHWFTVYHEGHLFRCRIIIPTSRVIYVPVLCVSGRPPQWNGPQVVVLLVVPLLLLLLLRSTSTISPITTTCTSNSTSTTASASTTIRYY